MDKYNKRLQIYLTEDVYKKVQAECKAKGIQVSVLIRTLIMEKYK